MDIQDPNWKSNEPGSINPTEIYREKPGEAAGSCSDDDVGGMNFSSQKPNFEQASTTTSSGNIKEKVTEQSREALEKAKAKTKEMGQMARSRAEETFMQQKGRALDTLDGISSALRHSSDQLKNEQHETIGHYAGTFAQNIDQFRDRMQDKDLGYVLHEVEDFARRRPEVFLGGALLLGFLAARFLKSSERETNFQRSDIPVTRGQIPSHWAATPGGQQPSSISQIDIAEGEAI